jgi:hypothetical protein
MVLLALVVGSYLASGQKANLAPVLVLAPPYSIPPQKTPIPDRWIPRSWGWLWRLKETVLGKAKALSMNITACELDSVAFGMQAEANPEFRGLLNHPDFCGTNGIKVWLLPNSKIRELHGRFSPSAGSNSFFRCGITTADKCQASLTTGGSADLLQVDVLPLVHKSTTDLTFILKLIAPVAVPPAQAGLSGSPPSQTKVPAAIRVQLPGGTGFFVLNSQRKTSDRVEAAVLVTVEPPNSKAIGTRPAAIVKRAN